ncbi:MAG TPA: hypothetical protein VFG69_02190 [Nannocystaceae bacterium]|nr:hypothetical protein [Nannocystaceae bacterium]
MVAAACARHEAGAAFRRTVFIGDRGISVPLPPPSLIDAPKQEVDVHADALGDDPVLAGTVAHVEDAMGEGVDQLELAADAQQFVIEALPVDLTANCLELWLVAPDGRESAHALVHAEIALVPDGEGDVADDDDASDELVVTVPGCD